MSSFSSEITRSTNPCTRENATTIIKLGINPMITWVVLRVLLNCSESFSSEIALPFFIGNVLNHVSPGFHDKLLEKFSFPMFFHSSDYKKKLQIMKEIDELDDSLKRSKMKKYLELGKNAIEPMFNCLNPEYRKLQVLADHYKINIFDLANIWNKKPIFDNCTAYEREMLFSKLLSDVMLTEFCTKDN
ncbi:MAG: hypothetical protein K940chlam5_00188 [Candidatus Anoxychlamydiales bacterium]|nr:hypothetical protein [Candidatus Anoxychlamydiales bacterium]